MSPPVLHDSRRREGRGADGPRAELPGSSHRVALFAEVVMVGAVIAPLILLVIPAVPALAVAVRHLERQVDGNHTRLRDTLSELGTALRGLWLIALVTPIAVLLLGFNVWLASTGALPGGEVVGVVSVAVGAAAAVVALRTASRWAPGRDARSCVREAAARARDDLGGSALLVAAVVMAVVIVWMLVVLLLVVGGLLALAALAVERRCDVAGSTSSR